MNSSTRYDTEAERLALGILPGTNFSSDGVLPVSFAYSLGSATGTADEKSAKAFILGPVGNNTDGYAWGTKFGTALMHSGLITQGQTNQIFNVKVISLGPKESFIKGPDNNLIASYPGDWKACAYRLELVISGTTQPPGTTTPVTTRPPTTQVTTSNIPVAPRITAFAVGSPSGIPTWTLTYFTNPSQILRVQLWVISGPSGLLNNGSGPAMVYPKKIWEKLLDSRQWTGQYATAESLKGYVRNTLIGGTNTFQLCAELAEDARAKECTGYAGQTRYDGSKLTQHVTLWLA